MCQEAEREICKPVLGALSVASVFLALFGNLAFSPKTIVSPDAMIADTEQLPAAKRSPMDEQPPIAEPVLLTEPAAVSEHKPVVERVLLADQSPAAEQVPLPVGVPVAAVAPAAERGPVFGPVMVAEQPPVDDRAPVDEPAPLGKRTNVADREPTTDETVFVRPADGRISTDETGSDVSVAEVRSEPILTPPDYNRDERSQTAAVAETTASVVVPQELSRHDRRVLRRIAHLEKKKDRLLNEGRPIVCRVSKKST